MTQPTEDLTLTFRRLRLRIGDADPLAMLAAMMPLLHEAGEEDGAALADAFAVQGFAARVEDDGTLAVSRRTHAADAPPAAADDAPDAGTDPEGDADIDRLLDRTNAHLGETEGSRRRSAIVHLRAAVAATRADGVLRAVRQKTPAPPPAAPVDASAAPVVPRRPQPRPAGGTGRPVTRPAPLVPAPAAPDAPQAAAQPVRPRRITARQRMEHWQQDDTETEAGTDASPQG
ncbi:lipoprotein, putative [Oceaniovalibus guishaninsula JLT2003]|uniref:Lipoprotein, putative n=1 Tax=Oceaniovalibus guishaninsula JLT2003 TaxID=1231392 RepID=K2GNY1_9RHOB|nr:hypothetical protein [Oceaniovalibus guishaninsula]EKE44396.1 lipoprotein, putative [Oceaniovalibus guishaninsula JLT2003]